MRTRFRLAVSGLLIAVALVASGCATTTPETSTPVETKAKGGVLRLELIEPAQLDPAQSDDSEELVVTRALYEGLVNYDEKTAATVPGVATKWTPNADSTVWTFNLRKDSTFSNGEKVTAESFIRGWNRATSPPTGEEDTSPIAYHLAGVAGYTKHYGDAAAKPAVVGDGKGLSGLKAIDPYTLEVTLSAPDPELAIKTGHTVAFPLPSQAAMDAQKPSFSEFPIGNGQFMLKGPEPWKHDQEIRAVPNPNYKGGDDATTLEEVVWRIFPDQDTMYLEWVAGNLDYIRVPPDKIAEAQSTYKAKLLSVPTTVLTYVGITIKKAPMDNKKARQAFSMAIDRDAIIKAIFNNTQVAARGIQPPVMPGFRKDGPCKYCDFNVAEAKKLLAESGFKVTEPLILAFNTGAGHENWTQAVVDQLQTNLGVTVKLEPVTGFSQNFIPRLRAGKVSGLFRLGWGMDYPTPWNFLGPLFGTEAIGHDNLVEYSNPAFDALLKEAATKPDVAARIKLYQQAEDLVLEDMPIIPMWFRISIRLANNDKFGGLGVDPFDNPSVSTTYLKKAASPAAE